MKYNSNLLVSIIAVALSGCASDPVADYVKKQADASEARTELMSESIAAAPDWYVNPPTSDDSGVYAVATSKSSDLQYSREMAILQAEYSIAKTINNEVSGKERLHRSQANSGFNSTADQTVVKNVAAAEVLGYRVVQQEVRAEMGMYVSYVLIHMPYEVQQRMVENKNNNFQKVAETRYRAVEDMNKQRQVVSTSTEVVR
jgi:hypothetical protein